MCERNSMRPIIRQKAMRTSGLISVILSVMASGKHNDTLNVLGSTNYISDRIVAIGEHVFPCCLAPRKSCTCSVANFSSHANHTTRAEPTTFTWNGGFRVSHVHRAPCIAEEGHQIQDRNLHSAPIRSKETSGEQRGQGATLFYSTSTCFWGVSRCHRQTHRRKQSKPGMSGPKEKERHAQMILYFWN